MTPNVLIAAVLSGAMAALPASAQRSACGTATGFAGGQSEGSNGAAQDIRLLMSTRRARSDPDTEPTPLANVRIGHKVALCEIAQR